MQSGRSSPHQKMDPFNLPAPLALQILKWLRDFVTLQLVLRASPAADVVFRSHALEIIRSIADLCLPLHVPRLLWVVLRVRSNRDVIPARLDTLDQFIDEYVYGMDAIPPPTDILRPWTPPLLPCLRLRLIG